MAASECSKQWMGVGQRAPYRVSVVMSECDSMTAAAVWTMQRFEQCTAGEPAAVANRQLGLRNTALPSFPPQYHTSTSRLHTSHRYTPAEAVSG